jgi:hypothetical protein
LPLTNVEVPVHVPAKSTAQLTVTVSLRLLIPSSPIHDIIEPPGGAQSMDAGGACRTRSGVGITLNVVSVVVEAGPLLTVTLKGYVPTASPDFTVTVSAKSVSLGYGNCSPLKEHDAPDGRPEQLGL